MTREEFNAAKRVLEEGGPTHSMYVVEDAKRALAPVRRGYYRLLCATLVLFLAMGTLLSVFVDDSWWAFPTAIALTGPIPSIRRFREWFVPVRGLKLSDLRKAAYLS